VEQINAREPSSYDNCVKIQFERRTIRLRVAIDMAIGAIGLLSVHRTLHIDLL
jgi:hypothetical protein